MNWILANQLKSNNVETRLAAGQKVASQNANSILRDVNKILDSKSREMRIGGLFVALAMKPHVGRKIVVSLLGDADPSVRIEVLRILREQKSTDFSAEICQSLNDSEEKVILEAIETAIVLNEDAAASYLACLLEHPSQEVRRRVFISARELWKYEHLEKLKSCRAKADIGYADEVNATISSIEARSKLLAQALEKNSNKGQVGNVEKPRFKSAMVRLVPNSNAGPSVAREELDALLLDNTDFEDLDGFTGFIKEVGLQDLIQLACINRKSQAFEITTKNGSAHIYVCEGEIVHAKFGEEVGREALFDILSYTSGKFKEIKYTDPEERTIHSPWEFLLMEAARIQDESAAAPGDF